MFVIQTSRFPSPPKHSPPKHSPPNHVGEAR
jgi:hypothetical protein